MAEIGNDIRKAVTILNVGGLVAVPTETVYGLAGNALDESAVREIYRVKQRPLDKPLAIQLSRVEDIMEYCIEIPKEALVLARKYWPGPLTLVLKKSNKVPDIVTSGQPTVGIRIPNHPVTLELLKQLDYPLAVPSANISGYTSPKNTSSVNQQLPEISYILEGGSCAVGKESTLVSLVDKKLKILRHGAIPKDDILKTLKMKL